MYLILTAGARRRKREEELAEVKERGRIAFHLGTKKEDNPFGYFEDKYTEWVRGWDEAEEKDIIEKNTLALSPAIEKFEKELDDAEKYMTFSEWLNKFKNQ